tara:strand:+ start:218 stop:580 length:363 start_codon:yes stop_codon:yes gene_type:complete
MNAQVNIKEMMEKFAETTRVSIKRIENTKEDGYVLWFAKSKLAVDLADNENIRSCLVCDASIFTQKELDSIEKHNAPMPSIGNSNEERAILMTVTKAKKLQIEKLTQELANFENYEGEGA